MCAHHRRRGGIGRIAIGAQGRPSSWDSLPCKCPCHGRSSCPPGPPWSPPCCNGWLVVESWVLCGLRYDCEAFGGVADGCGSLHYSHPRSWPVTCARTLPATVVTAAALESDSVVAIDTVIQISI